MAGTMLGLNVWTGQVVCVSMESGLDGRNNRHGVESAHCAVFVSMESGLDGRNNDVWKVVSSVE